jgi:hypothetical protein
VRELIAHGAAVDAQAPDGWTALIHACARGRLAAATALLDAGADHALLDRNGRSARRFAERRVERDDEEPAEGVAPPTDEERAEHLQLVELLEARGAA